MWGIPSSLPNSFTMCGFRFGSSFGDSELQEISSLIEGIHQEFLQLSESFIGKPLKIKDAIILMTELINIQHQNCLFASAN